MYFHQIDFNASSPEALSGLVLVEALNTTKTGELVSVAPRQVMWVPPSVADAMSLISTTPAPAVRFGDYSNQALNLLEEVLVLLTVHSDGFADALPFYGTGIYRGGFSWRCVGDKLDRARDVVSHVVRTALRSYPLLSGLVDVHRIKIETELVGEDWSVILPFNVKKSVPLTLELDTLSRWGSVKLCTMYPFDRKGKLIPIDES